MPESMHSKDIGLHLGPDRIAEKMTVVTLAMQDPTAAKAFYNDKLGFVPVGGGSRLAFRYGLPGSSGEAVEIVPVESLGAKSSITLETSSIRKAEATLTSQKVPFIPAKPNSGEGIVVTDPDGNLINIVSAR
jgi:catechol 2,3-dioxygenase-like lactoylglutathione lyase family enzyme